MKYKLIAAFDRRINAFMPVQAINDMLDEDIVESNRRAVLGGQIPEAKAQVLTVFRVGEFDDSTGVITTCSPVALCNLASFIPKKEVVAEDVNDGKSREENRSEA